jgi:hypothetical protein
MPARFICVLVLISLVSLSCEDQNNPSTSSEATDAGITLNDQLADNEGGETSMADATVVSDMGMIGDIDFNIAGGESMMTGGEERMPSCLISCAEFVECTIKQCPGYDDEDDSLLMQECLGLCTTSIAEIFDRLTGCVEKIRFAATVRTDFLNFCDSESEGFCETYIATCGEWLGETQCEDHYNNAPEMGSLITSGAHRRCYEFHLGSAMSSLDDGDEAGVREGCERAAGLNTCIDQ